jgi:hypothetical protein
MKKLVLIALLAASVPAAAQKWVDEKGRVYYGEPPRGVKVRPAEMKGGGTGIVAGEEVQRPLRSRAKAAPASGAVVEYVPDRDGAKPDPERR